MNTISKKSAFSFNVLNKPKPSFREDLRLIVGRVDLYDYYVVSPEQRAVTLEEEDAVLMRKHSYSY